MKKSEFLFILRGRITGRIPTGEVASQVDYYSAYIDGRVGAGLTEEEAVAELGDPQLIAKTVVESTDRAAEAAGYDGRYRSSTDTYDDSDGVNSGIFGSSANTYSGSSYSGAQQEAAGRGQDDETAYQRAGNQGVRQKKAGGGTGCVIAVVIFVLVMAVAWTLTSFVFRLGIRLLGWLFPIIAVVAIFALIINLFRQR